MDKEVEDFLDFMREELGDQAIAELFRDFLGADSISSHEFMTRGPQVITENKNGVIYNE